MKIDKKLIKWAKQLRFRNNQNALGYEGNIYFSDGYISSLVDAGIINRVQSKVLKKCFAKFDDSEEDSYYFDYKLGKEVKIDLD